MTVHELYAEKQKKYQEYQVQRGIYERRLEDSLEKLMNTAVQLQSVSKNISDLGTRSCIESLVTSILEAKDSLSDPQVLSAITERLAGISATLENVIQEALR